MLEYPDKEMPAISHKDAVAAIRRHGSARAAAEATGASFKTMCRRLHDLGLVNVTFPVHQDTESALRRLTASQWDELEQWCVENAPEAEEE